MTYQSVFLFGRAGASSVLHHTGRPKEGTAARNGRAEESTALLTRWTAHEEKSLRIKFATLKQTQGIGAAILTLFGGKIRKDQAEGWPPIFGACGFRHNVHRLSSPANHVIAL